MTTYDFSPNYNLAPLGDFVTASQKLVFPSTCPTPWHWNGDTGTKHIFSIVVGPDGQHWMKSFYPVGSYGAPVNGYPDYNEAEYQVSAPWTDELNLEYDLIFMTGFDFHSQGKTPMRIDSVNNNYGIRVMWNSALATSNPNYLANTISFFRMYQGNSDGTHPVEAHTPWKCEENTLYKIHLQFSSGPGGHAKISIKRPTDPAEILYMTSNVVPAAALAGQAFLISVSTFFGGEGRLISALRDCWTLSRITRIYSAGSVVTPPGPTIHSAKITLT